MTVPSAPDAGDVLSAALSEQLEDVGTAEIVVGIPSFNNASTIGHVTRAVLGGLGKYFYKRKALVINADGGSTDGTPERVEVVSLENPRAILLAEVSEIPFKFSVPYRGIPGKGSAFRTVFAAASQVKARACAVVDSDLRSITPEWVELLIKPVLEGDLDFIAPLYHRHKFDGTITNGIIYPLTRALYGRRVRQPIGGDFGFSGDLASLYSSRDVWSSTVAKFGIDIWMTTTAIAEGFRVGQAFLGSKIHDSKDPASDLSDMLFQVVGSAFRLMEDYSGVWTKVEGSVPVPTLGFVYESGAEPVTVNVGKMLDHFRAALRDFGPVWAPVLSPGVLAALAAAGKARDAAFRLEDEIWFDVIAQFALAWRRKVIDREHLLKSLTPLYLGRTAGFVTEHRDSGAHEVEARIEDLCLVFERGKTGLAAEWARSAEGGYDG